MLLEDFFADFLDPPDFLVAFFIETDSPYLAPVPLGGSKESEVRKTFFQRSATGKLQMCDPDGNWLDITDE